MINVPVPDKNWLWLLAWFGVSQWMEYGESNKSNECNL